ncbi:hypothetical protein FGW20_12640 [Methanoculleus sp. FWC-SCC3]|uniref:Uncharacterized protein n=1 Tax=Methanoculleus methanifontis TaxID=2584086 RepID=A0ABT8M5H1_9EURY|nr:hypothetical protein [Methanoculleus sp. FWC-SCC3]MDN7013857.1 hypothetical protein [Methanoculleus sp. FWC-SCC3]
MNELQKNNEISPIVLQSISLRGQGNWAEADKCIDTALLEYPSDIDLLTEYANVMMDRAYWSEGNHSRRMQYYLDASERLKAILNTYPELAPATVYNKLGLVYIKLGYFDDAESIIKTGMSKYPENIELFITHGRIRDKLRYNHISNLFRGFINKYVKQLFDKATSARIENFLFPYKYCLKTEVGHNCYQNFKKGNISGSINSFLKLVDLNELSDTSDIWLDSYYQLIRASTNEAIIPKENYLPSIELKPQSVKKILVSGMGWSGSGAMLYFFRDFNTVKLYSVEEDKFINGTPSLRTLRDTVDDLARFNDELIDFFWFTLFGFAKYSSASELCSTRTAIKRTLGNHPNEYALAVNLFLKEIYSSIQEDSLGKLKFDSISSKFINAVLRPALTKQQYEQSILLNNVIAIHDISLCSMLDNFNILCSFRDPRAQFVSIMESNPHYKESLFCPLFIRNYRNIRAKFLLDLKELKIQEPYIHSVQFEEFVLDEEYRNSITERIGLDLTCHRGYIFFDPKVSEKNIYNYKKYRNQKIIQKIETELSEYCWDPN